MKYKHSLLSCNQTLNYLNCCISYFENKDTYVCSLPFNPIWPNQNDLLPKVTMPMQQYKHAQVAI